jgi:RsiW-degrading membrane proteinase PrsW (M82 family)
MIWVATQIGLDGVAVGLPISAAVALPIVALILWLDRWERERPRLLVSAFAWGACIAAFCAIWSQEGLQALVDSTLGVDAGAWIRPLVITPVTEEVFKGLFLVWLLVWRRREITGLVDGVVFGALIGAGFSFTESILYLGRAVTTFAAADSADVNAVVVLAITFFLRVVMVPFFHPFLVAVFGLGVAAAANGRGRRVRIGVPIAGLAAAIVLHGIWDWAGLASDDPLLMYKIYGAVMVPLFLAMVITSFVLRHREGRMIGAALPVLARDGRIAAEEVAALASLHERRLWRQDARRRAGRPAARALGRYQAEASALAIRTTRAHRGGSHAALDAQARVTAAARARMLEMLPPAR